MKRVVLLAAMVLLSVPAWAQQGSSQSLSEGVIAVAPASRSGVILADAAGADLGRPSAEQARTPSARGSGSMRRPSMVGYIEDSTIGTGLRLRFDSARHITAPDRAEFFYSKCGCYAGLPRNLAVYDPDAPGFPSAIMTDTNAQHLYILGEYGFMQNRASVFGELPVRWLKPQTYISTGGIFDDQSGISDLRLGAKFGLMATDRGQATVLLRFTVPTGDAAKGLGTDHASFEPALVVSNALNDRVGLEAQFGAVLPTGGSAGLPTSSPDKFSGQVLYYGIGPSFDVYSSSTVRFAPVVELVGWRVLSGFQTGNPDLLTGPDTGFAKAKDVAPNIVNIKVGARLIMRDAASIYVGYGKHLTDAAWYDDIFRIEYRVGFGR